MPTISVGQRRTPGRRRASSIRPDLCRNNVRTSCRVRRDDQLARFQGVPKQLPMLVQNVEESKKVVGLGAD